MHIYSQRQLHDAATIDHLITYFRTCRANRQVSGSGKTLVTAGQSADLWSCQHGLGTLIAAVQTKRAGTSYSVARSLARKPLMLPEAILTFSADDLRKVRSSLKNHPGWGKTVYDYLQVCWMVARCDAQTVIRIKASSRDASFNHIAALRAHVIAIQNLARSDGESIFWTFDGDYEAAAKRSGSPTIHVHLYARRPFLERLQGFGALAPFYPRHTHMLGIFAVSRPKLVRSGIVAWPRCDTGGNRVGYINTPAYAATKVVGLRFSQARDGKCSVRRHSPHGKLLALFKTYKGGRYRHWGAVGFGLHKSKP